MNTQAEANVPLNTKIGNDLPLQRDDKRRLITPDIESDKYLRVEDTSIFESDKSRKKPGRKPSTSEPANKRLAQNRAAQRAFRERKDNYVKELEDKVQELENARRLAEEENKKLQSRLAEIQNKLKEETESTSSKVLSSNTFESSEDRTVNVSSSKVPKSFEISSGDTNLESWSSPQKNSLPITIADNTNFIFSGNNLMQNNSFSQFTEDHSFISPPSAFSLNDYMLPYGSLVHDPLIDINSGINYNTNPNMVGINSFNNDFNLGFNQALFDYSSLTSDSFPTDFSAFDPVLYADFIQSFDPYNLNGLPTSTPTPSYESLKETTPSLSSNEPNRVDAGHENINVKILDQAKKETEEIDLDSLCSLLKDKATCSEIKQFYNTHCKDSVV